MSGETVFLAPLTRLQSPQTAQWATLGACGAQLQSLTPRRRNIYFGGRAHIAGTVKKKGTPDQPLVRPVYLYEEKSHTLVASTWSASDGSYRFDDLDPSLRYSVVSYDTEHQYRAVIADNLQAEI